MVTIRAYELKTHDEKTKGLLGFKEPIIVFFRTRFGIHTFFMKYPIDVAVLDNESRVKTLRINLLPNNIYFWNPFYNVVLEMPAGTIEKLNIKKGEQLKIVLT